MSSESDLRVVGKRVPAYGAENKVTGAARYSIDYRLPGMHVGRILQSPHAHARIKKIDKSRAEALPGVSAVLTWEDVPHLKLNPSVQDWNLHDTSNEINDMYVISEKAHFVGDIVAAVAAVDGATADEAIRLLNVEYEVLPAVFDVEEAMKPGAPQVHDFTKGNISVSYRFPGSYGDADAALAVAPVRVEATFKTSKQYTMALEPLNCLAGFEPTGDLNVWMPVQRPLTFRKKVAQMFGLPESKVHVMCEYGGGFFGEAYWTVLPICVALAKKAGRPVKLEYSRSETVLNTASREAYLMTGWLGANEDGTLTALKENVIVESGAYFNRSSATTNVHMADFVGLYRCPNALAEMTAVYSHIPMASGFRGYGGPAAFFLLEQLMDMAAEKLGMDPVEFRLKNVRHMGEMGHAFPLETATLAQVIELGAKKIGWAEKRSRPKGDGVVRRGVGMACYYDVSGGQPFERFDRHVAMELNEDGRVTAIFNHPDGGMNLLGSVAQIAAEVLGIRYQDVCFVHESTDGKMWDAGMAANSGLYTVGNAILRAAKSLKARIIDEAAIQTGAATEDIDVVDGMLWVKGEDQPRMSLQRLAHSALYEKHGPNRSIGVMESYFPDANPNPVGAAFADVAVDVETGVIKLERLVFGHDIGRAINPMTVEGQLEGGISMGVGYALFEDACIDPHTGVLRGDNYNSYKIPSTLDMPELDLIIHEEPTQSGPFGAKGVGMCGVTPVAAAVANALYDAAGVRLKELPLTPERVLAALKNKE
jgi:xanthine dehydrogenase molybdenum-binding subunit